MSSEDDTKHHDVPPKREYVPPRLTALGTAAELTKGVTAHGNAEVLPNLSPP